MAAAPFSIQLNRIERKPHFLPALKSMAIHAILLTMLVLAPFVVLALLAQRSESASKHQLLKDGELGEAEILGYEKDEYLYVRYRFTPSDQAQAIVCKKLVENLAERFPVGTKVPVRYLKRHPHVSLLVPYAQSQASTT